MTSSISPDTNQLRRPGPGPAGTPSSGSRKVFREPARRCAARRRTLVLDWRGRGGSERLAEDLGSGELPTVRWPRSSEGRKPAPVRSRPWRRRWRCCICMPSRAIRGPWGPSSRLRPPAPGFTCRSWKRAATPGARCRTRWPQPSRHLRIEPDGSCRACASQHQAADGAPRRRASHECSGDFARRVTGSVRQPEV